MIAAAMTSCRGAEKLLMPRVRIPRLKTSTLVRSSDGVFGKFFRNCESVVAQHLLKVKCSTSAFTWRQRASVKKDFCSTEDAGEIAVSTSAMANFLVLPALVGFSGAANAIALEPHMAYIQIGHGLEFGLQLIYWVAMLSLLGRGSFLVVRQALIRRQLDFAAKKLQEIVRSGQASSQELFERGVLMLRKKYYVRAIKNLEHAITKWDGDEAELAEVYNALGFCYFAEDKLDTAITQYEKAAKLQPGYVIAWNNLGNAYELKMDFKNALKTYEEALQLDPRNKFARRQRDSMKERLVRFDRIQTQD